MSQLAISTAAQFSQAALRNTPRYPLSDRTLSFRLKQGNGMSWVLEYDVPVWHGTYCDNLWHASIIFSLLSANFGEGSTGGYERPINVEETCAIQKGLVSSSRAQVGL